MNIFYAIGLEMVFMAMGFYYVLLTVLQFSKILVSLTLHNSRLPPSYWIFAVRKPENANSTLPGVAGMDKITGANWYSSYLDIFESFSASG